VSSQAASWVNAIGPSLLIVVGGVITWLIKSKIEELRTAQRRLTAKRLKIYSGILEPYIQILHDIKSGKDGTGAAIRRILSLEYRRTAFELCLMGSDEVVRAYNDLMQWSFKMGKSDDPDTKGFIRLFARFLLAIRKSVGNRGTRLEEIDMLRWMINDIETLNTT